MIHGRVVGNELREVPPERLPIWGQRWLGNHPARAASPFETRTFQVTTRGMFQVGQAQSSPSQFYATIGGAGQEDGGSSPNPTYGPPPSPPVQTHATQLTSGSSESSTSQVAYHSLLHHYRGEHMPSMPQGQPNPLYPNPVHPVPRRETAGGPPGALLPRQAGSEFPPSTHHHIPPFQRGLVPLEYDDTFWHTNSPSTNTQPRAGSSRGSHVSSGRLHEFMPLDAPHWQFAAGPSQSLTRSPQLDSSLHSERSYHLHPHNRTGAYLTPTSPSPQSFTAPLSQQNDGSFWNPEANVPAIPTTLSFQNPTTAQWPSGLAPLIPEPLQAAGSSSDIDEELRRLFSDPNDSEHPSPLESPGLLLSPADGSILPSDVTHGSGQSTQMIG